MDYKELLEKYNLLLSENRRLIEENDKLRAQLGIAEHIYLARHLRGEKLEEIGGQFGISEYSSVSSLIEKVKRDMSAERKLRVRVKNIEKILYNSQQQI